MSKLTINPVTYAARQFNISINEGGDFSYQRDGLNPLELRTQIMENPRFRVARRLIDLDRDVSTLFVDNVTGARVFLREWACNGARDCWRTHGRLAISATSFDYLTAAIAMMDVERFTVEDYLDNAECEPHDLDD
jgi:hypothetical protein